VADIRESAIALDATGELPKEGPLAVTITVTGAPAEELAAAKRRADVAEMPADVRKHYDGLDEAGKTAFLAKDAATRASDVDAIQKGDPVAYTCEDGTVIRKSDGPLAARLAKQADEQAKVIKGLTEGGAADAIAKRAGTEFPNVAAATATFMLKSAAAVGIDTDAGKDIVKSLTAMNKARAGAFVSKGSTEDEGDEDGTPGGLAKARQTFDGKVTEIAKRDKVSQADAMSKARTEAPDLYAAAYPAQEA
jgi:hypothetical protein